MSEFYLVDVKSITAKSPRSDFKVNEIESLAQSILETEGLISPLLLKQTGIESYEVLTGEREFYAAVRAKELNPRAAEMVNAFVIPEKFEEAAIDQFALLHQPLSPKAIPPSSEQVTQSTETPSNSDQRLLNLESRLDEALREIKQTHLRDIQRLEQQFNSLEQKIPQKIEPLEVFNTANSAELLKKMAVAGIRGKTAEKLIKGIEKARQKSLFISCTDVVKRVEGLADKRMLVILDAWGGLY